MDTNKLPSLQNSQASNECKDSATADRGLEEVFYKTCEWIDEQNKRVESWLGASKLQENGDASDELLDIENDAIEARSLLFDILNKSEMLSTEEAAAFLRMAVGTVRNWTSNGKIPPSAYRKAGSRVLYLKSELRELLLAQKLGGSSDGN